MKIENINITLTITITTKKGMVTLITKVTVMMINMITKIRITTITEKDNSDNDNSTATQVTIKTNNKQIENTNFKMELVSTIKWTEIPKTHSFTWSAVMGLFLHMWMTTMNTFPGTSLIVKKAYPYLTANRCFWTNVL